MPTWFVVYLAGHLAIVAGPVDDPAACLAFSGQLKGQLGQLLGNVDVWAEGKKLTKTDVVVTCISARDRPR